jgi:nicotinate phosphoribosyltransferase
LRRLRDGTMIEDLIALQTEAAEGEALLCPVMRNGRRLAGQPSLGEARTRCREQLASLPSALRGLVPAEAYPVAVSEGLKALAAEVDRELASAFP